MLKQIVAVTLLNLRSIPQRPGMSLATVISVALVVGVLLGFTAMANGFRSTVEGTGSEDVAVFLRSGAQAELNSGLSRDEVRLIEEAPGIARDAQGLPLVSAELYVIVDGTRRATGTDSNIPLRGVGPNAAGLRTGFTLVDGRMFESGTNELVVGSGIQREFTGFELGQEVRLGSNVWRVVGTFSTGGTVFDSEIWADLGTIQNLYQRGSSVQTVRARMESPAALDGIRSYAEAEPRLNLDVNNEKQFYAGQAGGTSDLIMVLGWPLAIAMAVGAFAGAWNTMYSSVDRRTREIATLRAIGFGGGPAFFGTMAEALLLALIGGVVGTIGVYLLLNGVSASTLGSGFTQIVFSFAITPQAALNGLIFALVIGFLGGIVPAFRAARVPILSVHAD